MEIDFLRNGQHTVYVPEEEVAARGSWHYLLALFDAYHPFDQMFWRLSLRDALPVLALPLTEDVGLVMLDSQASFRRCCREHRLCVNIDYAAEPVPPLSPDDAAWADALLREAGLR